MNPIPTPSDRNGMSADEALAMLQTIAVDGHLAEVRVEPAPLLSSTAASFVLLLCLVLSVLLRRVTHVRH